MILLEIAVGLALGYLLGSLLESAIHEYVPDAPPRVLALWRRHPRLFRRFLDAHFSHHVVHHHQTFHDHVTQFVSSVQRERVETLVRRRGRHGRVILRNGFSDRLHDDSIVEFSLPWLAAGLAIALAAPASIGLAATVPLMLPGLLGHYVHPWLHRRFADGQQHAPGWLAALLRSRYMRAVYRNHFLHHRYGGTGNFNLVLGGDWLRGRLRRATDADREAMRHAGMPVGVCAAVARGRASSNMGDDHAAHARCRLREHRGCL